MLYDIESNYTYHSQIKDLSPLFLKSFKNVYAVPSRS